MFSLWDYSDEDVMLYFASKSVAERVFKAVPFNRDLTEVKFYIYRDGKVRKPGNERTTIEIASIEPMTSEEESEAAEVGLDRLEWEVKSRRHNPYGKPNGWEIVGTFPNGGPIGLPPVKPGQTIDYAKLDGEGVRTYLWDLYYGKLEAVHREPLMQRHYEIFKKRMPEFMK